MEFTSRVDRCCLDALVSVGLVLICVSEFCLVLLTFDSCYLVLISVGLVFIRVGFVFGWLPFQLYWLVLLHVGLVLASS